MAKVQRTKPSRARSGAAVAKHISRFRTNQEQNANSIPPDVQSFQRTDMINCWRSLIVQNGRIEKSIGQSVRHRGRGSSGAVSAVTATRSPASGVGFSTSFVMQNAAGEREQPRLC